MSNPDSVQIKTLGQRSKANFASTIDRVLLDNDYRLRNVLFYCHRQFDEIETSCSKVLANTAKS